MRNKIIDIFVCVLLIAATVLPVAGNVNNYQIMKFLFSSQFNYNQR